MVPRFGDTSEMVEREAATSSKLVGDGSSSRSIHRPGSVYPELTPPELTQRHSTARSQIMRKALAFTSATALSAAAAVTLPLSSIIGVVYMP